MSQRAVASRYAEGLFGSAQGQAEVEALRQEVDQLVRLAATTPSLRSLLERPDLDAEQKMAALEAALGGEVRPQVMGLLSTLVKHRRGEHLQAVAEAFGRLADEAAGVVHATVRVAVPLTGEQRDRLTAALRRLTGGKVVLEERVDPAVLAGASVQVGDRLIDGTAAGRLAQLRQTLLDTEGRPR
jgi:F-type H+-transporting ATPase subunit delta